MCQFKSGYNIRIAPPCPKRQDSWTTETEACWSHPQWVGNPGCGVEACLSLYISLCSTCMFCLCWARFLATNLWQSDPLRFWLGLLDARYSCHLCLVIIKWSIFCLSVPNGAFVLLPCISCACAGSLLSGFATTLPAELWGGRS